MKVLHFSSALSWRGGEQQIAYLLAGLPQETEQLVLCVKDAPLAAYCAKNDRLFFTYRKRSSIDPAPARLAAKICKEQGVDLVHVHDSHAHTFAVIAATFFGLQAPLVVSRRVDFPIRSGFLSSWKYNHSSVRAIICVSYFIKTIIKDRIRSSEKIHVVYSGIDLLKFKVLPKRILRESYQIPDSAPIIINVAAIAPHKDYFTFVDTAALVLKTIPEARFFIIGGDGGEGEAVRQYVQRCQLSEYIYFTGFRKDLPEILPEADVFLFTSKTEGLGTSVLDALASKVPVVTTQAGGIPEIVAHQKSGLLAGVGDAPGLAAQVIKVLQNATLRTELIQGGWDKVQSFSYRVTAQQTFGIYQQVLGKMGT